MAVVEAKKALVIMMILYGAVAIFGILAAVPMMMHVFPQSECILFSSYNQFPSEKLNYGHYACKSSKNLTILRKIRQNLLTFLLNSVDLPSI